MEWRVKATMHVVDGDFNPQILYIFVRYFKFFWYVKEAISYRARGILVRINIALNLQKF